jgi:UPF0716 protein FxsA
MVHQDARPPQPARRKAVQPYPRRVESPPMTPARQVLTLLEKDLLLKLLLAFLAYSLVPLGEIFLFLYLASLIGNYLVLVLAAVVGVAGAFVGIAQARRIAARLKSVSGSPRATVEMAGLLVAGLLLVTPGFLSDLAGFLLLVPALRLRAGRRAAALLRDRAPTLYARLGLSASTI